MIATWPELKALALALNFPQVTLAYPFGHESLKAHAKIWCVWSPYVEAAFFHAEFDERETLIAADPATFFLHPHYQNYRYVLVRSGQIDPDCARARLTARWRALAPKRWLAEWDKSNA